LRGFASLRLCVCGWFSAFAVGLPLLGQVRFEDQHCRDFVDFAFAFNARQLLLIEELVGLPRGKALVHEVDGELKFFLHKPREGFDSVGL
jgi:hypothetical protein